ncbi:MAG TPA: aquaporin [Candidatus Nitrosopolaris sp.]|nr:aquaporin [Candidatus Nitrosopolaris sp.]
MNYNFNKRMAAKLGAELLGTGILAMMVLVMANTTAVSYFIATSAAVTVAAIVMMFGAVSGAHINPAVTFGLWTARRIGTVKAVAYIVAQALGGLGAWLLYQYFTNHSLASKTISFDTRLFIAEAVGAAIWVFGFTAVIARKAEALASAVALGTVVFASIMIAATASLGYVNPAVAVAARSISVVYVVGPLVGGLVGANLYTMLFEGSAKKAAAKK